MHKTLKSPCTGVPYQQSFLLFPPFFAFSFFGGKSVVLEQLCCGRRVAGGICILFFSRWQTDAVSARNRRVSGFAISHFAFSFCEEKGIAFIGTSPHAAVVFFRMSHAR